MPADDQWHEYALKLAINGELYVLRIDPVTAAGRLEIEWIRLRSPDGKLLKEWKFDGSWSAEPSPEQTRRELEFLRIEG